MVTMAIHAYAWELNRTVQRCEQMRADAAGLIPDFGPSLQAQSQGFLRNFELRMIESRSFLEADYNLYF